MKFEQDGYDIKYTEELQEYHKRKNINKENKPKAFVLIFGYCNKVMHGRIEESTEYETLILDNLIKLLKEFRKKMYNVARAKYQYTTLTESLQQIFDTKKDKNESIMDYTKRFKQTRDIVKDLVGTNILSKFVETLQNISCSIQMMKARN